MKIYCNSLLISKTSSKKLLLLFLVTQELQWKIHTLFSTINLYLAVNYLTVYGIQLSKCILSDRHNACTLQSCATKQLSNVLMYFLLGISVASCWWKRTWLQKARCNASAASAADTRSESADTHPGASRMGAPTFPVGALPRGNSLSAVAAGETTRRTTVGVLSGRKRGQHMQSRRPSLAERAPPQANLPLRKLSEPGLLPSRWTWARGGNT
jgi:hypothetical protein